MVHLARAHRLLADFLPKHLPNAAEAFSARAGIGLNEYMLAAAMLLGYSNQLPKSIDSKRSPWASISNIVANLKSHDDEITHVLHLACQTAADLHRDQPTRGETDLFEFATLQRRPFIEARTGEVVAPVLSLFVRQLLSFPFQILSEIKDGRTALGLAYEDYAHEVVSRIAKSDGAEPGNRCRAKRSMAARSTASCGAMRPRSCSSTSRRACCSPLAIARRSRTPSAPATAISPI